MRDAACPADCPVVELERELQTAACRADEARLRALLAPDFVEIGASGRRWDLESVVTMVLAEAQDPGGSIRMSQVEHRHLAADVVQVLWESERDGRRARRSSLWCRRGSAWQQVFHQGTPT